MTPFHLKIVTPDGLIFDGQAESVVVRTTGGDVAILAHHIDYVAPLGMGMAAVVTGGERRRAACIGGMLSVSGGDVTLVPTTFEWAEQIDAERVEASYERANRVLNDSSATNTEIALAEARLRRALVRRSVASYK